MSSTEVTTALEIWRSLERDVRGGRFFSGEDIILSLEKSEIGQKYLHRSPTEAFDTNAISGLSNDLSRAEFMHRIFKALAVQSSELVNLCTRTLEPISLKLSKGLASLSDDLLSLIFKFIVHSEKDGTKLAFRLSHVCRKFRAMSLADCTLWSTLTLHTGKELEIAKLKTLISRSGSNTELHIATIISSPTSTLHDAASAFSETASRWRTLSLDVAFILSGITIAGELVQIMKEHFLTLPRLEELQIHGDGHWKLSTATFADIRPWEAPNLHILRCTRYIPPPSFPFTSITTMTLSVVLHPGVVRRQVAELFAFLSSQANISDFLLKLGCNGLRSYHPGEKFDPTPIVCPAITSFKLVIPVIYPEKWIDDARSVVVPILNAFRMPKLENFSLSIEMKEFGRDFFTDARTLPELFMPNPDHHPLLTSFTFTALVTVDPDKPKSSYSKLVEFDIPLDKLPRVSSLCVTTFGRFIFSRTPGAGKDAALVDKLNALQELQLCSCIHLNAKALRAVVQSLKDVGAWDTLERVVIRDCRLLNYQLALAVVGKERLFFSES